MMIITTMRQFENVYSNCDDDNDIYDINCNGDDYNIDEYNR